MFETKASQRFFQEWRALRTENGVPHYRTVFDDLSVDLLPELLILEEGDKGAFNIRFMGTQRVDAWGGDLTATDSFKVLSAEIAESFRINSTVFLAHPCGMIAIHRVVNTEGRQYEVERILLPVGNDPGKPRRIMLFNSELDGVAFTRPDGRILEARGHAWVDIGFGVPAEPPHGHQGLPA